VQTCSKTKPSLPPSRLRFSRKSTRSLTWTMTWRSWPRSPRRWRAAPLLKCCCSLKTPSRNYSRSANSLSPRLTLSSKCKKLLSCSGDFCSWMPAARLRTAPPWASLKWAKLSQCCGLSHAPAWICASQNLRSALRTWSKTRRKWFKKRWWSLETRRTARFTPLTSTLPSRTPWSLVRSSLIAKSSRSSKT